MAESRVASRYVKSLLVLARENKVLDKVHKDLQLFSKIVEENRELLLVLKNPIIHTDKKQSILKGIFGGKVSDLTMAFFDILCRKGREPLLPFIAKEFHLAYNTEMGIGQASITSSMPLDAKLRKQIEEIAKKLSNRNQIELLEKVDGDMIGGFVLNVGDRQVDASVRNKLNRLKTKLSQNPYVKEF